MLTRKRRRTDSPDVAAHTTPALSVTPTVPPAGTTGSHVKTPQSPAKGLPLHLFHLVEDRNWPFIQEQGLLSASQQLERSALPRSTVQHLQRTQRTRPFQLPHGAVLRDQTPMPAAALERCLVNMSAPEWYQLLNSKVFFWTSIERLNRVRTSALVKPSTQFALVIDCQRLLRKYARHAAVTPFNVGNARRNPSRRGRATIVPLEQYCQSGWESEFCGVGAVLRARSHRPVEVVIDDAVPDILDFVVQVLTLLPGQTVQHDEGGYMASE